MANKTLPINNNDLWRKLYHSELRNHGDKETDYALWLKEQIEKGDKTNEKGNKRRKDET